MDPNGAPLQDAAADLENRVTGYKVNKTTDEGGKFRFDNVPFSSYELTVTAKGFSAVHQRVDVRSSIPIPLSIALKVSGVSEQVTVEGVANNLENVPSAHTDVGENLLKSVPITSPGAGLSEVLVQTVAGAMQGENGFFHPQGDHAQTTFSLDNQLISDQISKPFSTQVPVNAIQSLEVITGAVPAEYGDKTSLVVNAETKSGLGLRKPTGSFLGRYGSFGSTHDEATFGIGGEGFGNFTALTFERSGRFLDTPEFAVIHDRGTSAGLFERLDYNPTPKDSLHLNVLLGRNHFEIPNQFDQDAIGQDQRQLVRSADVALGWVHIFSPSTLLNINPYYRLDQVWYFPSANPFSDQTQTTSQQRRMTNAGISASIAYTKGHHNIKAGVQALATFVTEAFQFGITDPTSNDPASPNFLPGLLPFDLTRGGHLFTFNGHTDIKREAVYAQDLITTHGLSLSLGLRFDNYNGISHANMVQPRTGVSYLIKKTNTVLRGAYIRTMETPYNENIILSSSTGSGGLATNGVLDQSTSQQPLPVGRRNQFNLGIQQAIGKHLLVDGDYFWKFTRNGYDFNVLLNTPIFFPIAWNKSKIDAGAVRVTMTDYKGFSAYYTLGLHERARFFTPETGGLFFDSVLPSGVFRIDHDQAYQHSLQAQYQFHQIKRLEPYVNFTWFYASGYVSGSVPDFASALALTPDQQAQIGLFCGSTFATPTQGITSCTDPNHGALRVRIPADGTENDDTNSPRVAPRHIFSASVGTDNLFRTEHTRVTLRFTGVNLADRQALYNFLSTFSGTHFVTPRTLQVQMGIVF